ncbi:hypothetical protein PAAG_04682 [Paracoccidioides lutzii Pb01]|uniref:Uncharacterized protein n=1 Tax=Paracoccidioides lutzii (strain ATCC MYA-826 / Pb01) TaxID=502779 RepID=C1H252_PARBA|nr:hypothetical protein PAAG_04682 [Paracoccidioides lutzii Pb01]EEH33632.1 hypothetical protein PAAG_04682 [Paracoccidioides lutzii Pb01]
MPSDGKKTGGGGQQAPGHAKSDTKTSTSNSSVPSKYQFVKEGWGDRKNFQHSYGLGMGVDDFEEGNAILDKMMEHDVENMKKGNN